MHMVPKGSWSSIICLVIANGEKTQCRLWQRSGVLLLVGFSQPHPTRFSFPRFNCHYFRLLAIISLSLSLCVCAGDVTDLAAETKPFPQLKQLIYRSNWYVPVRLREMCYHHAPYGQWN